MDNTKLIQDTAKNELMTFLGVEIKEATSERVVMTMEVTPKIHQYVGIMHGGVSVLLAETAASVGAVISSDLEKVTPVGIEINANHLRAVSKGTITTTATPITHGKTMSIWNIEIRNENDKLICVSRCSILLRQGAAIRP